MLEATALPTKPQLLPQIKKKIFPINLETQLASAPGYQKLFMPVGFWCHSRAIGFLELLLITFRKKTRSEEKQVLRSFCQAMSQRKLMQFQDDHRAIK